MSESNCRTASWCPESYLSVSGGNAPPHTLEIWSQDTINNSPLHLLISQGQCFSTYPFTLPHPQLFHYPGPSSQTGYLVLPFWALLFLLNQQLLASSLLYQTTNNIEHNLYLLTHAYYMYNLYLFFLIPSLLFFLESTSTRLLLHSLHQTYYCLLCFSLPFSFEW